MYLTCKWKLVKRNDNDDDDADDDYDDNDDDDDDSNYGENNMPYIYHPFNDLYKIFVFRQVRTS